MKIPVDERKNKMLVDAIIYGKSLHFCNLSGISSESLSKFNRKREIDVISGIAVHFNDNKGFGPYKYGGCYSGQSLIVFKSIGSLLDMLKEFEKIEDNIQSEWTDKQKAVYIYGILSKDCTHVEVLSSHRFLTAGVGSYTSFAKVYYELLRRQGIEAYVFATHKHAFNMVKLDGKFYPVDVGMASKRLDHFFGRKDYFKIPEVIEIYNKFSPENRKKADDTYFEEPEISKILQNLVDGYIEQKTLRNNKTTREL